MENQDPFWLLVPPPPDELKTDLWLAPDPFERTDRKESKLEELTEENAEIKFKFQIRLNYKKCKTTKFLE